MSKVLGLVQWAVGVKPSCPLVLLEHTQAARPRARVPDWALQKSGQPAGAAVPDGSPSVGWVCALHAVCGLLGEGAWAPPEEHWPHLLSTVPPPLVPHQVTVGTLRPGCVERPASFQTVPPGLCLVGRCLSGERARPPACVCTVPHLPG